jgi:hypothetical protein
MDKTIQTHKAKAALIEFVKALARRQARLDVLAEADAARVKRKPDHKRRKSHHQRTD